MRDSLIRWKTSDYRELERGVNRFNKKIKRLEKIEDKIPLPEPLDFVQTRKEIKSRKELNRVLSSLESFSKRGSTDIVKLESGHEITKWEYSEIKKARRRVRTRLTREANLIRMSRPQQLGMGDERLEQIESILESYSDLEKRKGYDFTRTAKSIMTQGTLDINLKRAETFRKNFMQSLEQSSHLRGYDKLVNYLNKIKNPVDFYEKVKTSNVAMDFGVWYIETGEGTDNLTYGAFATSQDMFDQMLYELGIE